MSRHTEQIDVTMPEHLSEAVEEYADEYGCDESQAVREICERQLVADGRLDESDGSTGDSVADDRPEQRRSAQTADGVDETRQAVRDLRAEFDDARSAVRTMSPSLFLTVFWVVLLLVEQSIPQSFFSPPITVVLGGGVLTFLLASYLLVRFDA